MSPSRNAANAAEVGQGRPELPGRGHHAGVVLGLGQHDVGPRVHGAALAPRARPAAASSASCPAARAPRRGRRRPTTRPRSRATQLAEQAEAEVGVVEPPGGARGRRRRRSSASSSSEPPGVRSHQPPGLSAEAPARCESSWPIVRSPNGVPGRCRSSGSSRCSAALVAQPQHGDGGDRLADRAQPVLDVGVRLGDVAPAGRPGQPAVADDAGDEAGRPAVPLHAGGAGQEQARGGGQDGVGQVRP